MSLLEPRCMVCGAPLDRGAPFEKNVRKSEVCSDKCYKIYMDNEDDQEEREQYCGETDPRLCGETI